MSNFLVKLHLILFIYVLNLGCSEEASKRVEAVSDSRPNLVLIVADDLGFAEIGAFGSEIQTPNIDRLAETGMTFSQFYVAPGCSPTRSMLFSGVDNHIAGLGVMQEFLDLDGLLPPDFQALIDLQRGQPGYEGHMNFRVASIADLLSRAGYRTLMAGKWHLGLEKNQRPNARGFEKSFALLNGGASHFSDGWVLPAPWQPAIYTYNDEEVSLPDDFYSTISYTDHLIDWIASATQETPDKPFFGYLAFTAPHDPLHVPDKDLNLYAGQYDNGYEEVRNRRLSALQKLGLMPQTFSAGSLPQLPKWDSLTAQQQREEARRMEIYAAMVEVMDRQIGRLIEALERSGELENTLIVFMSDNGASPSNFAGYGFTGDEFDNSVENMGRKGSFTSYNINWARAGSAHLRLFKGTTAEGGIRVPLIITGPNVPEDTVSDAVLHVTDITQTFLDIAKAPKPETLGLQAMTGKSMKPVLFEGARSVRDENDTIGWAFLGQRALRMGRWKILWMAPPTGTGKWELYDIIDDPSEANDLAQVNPEILERLIVRWDEYVATNGVIVSGQTQ